MANSSSSKMTQIYVGLGVAALLGGVYWMNTQKEKANTNVEFQQGSKTSAPQIKVVPDEIDKLTLKAKDKAQVVLEKKDGNWAMVEPVAGAKVQKSTVDDVLNGLKGLTFKDPIAKGASNYASYDLDEGKAIHVVAAKGGSPVVDLWLGSQKTRGQMARVGQDDQIWSVSGISAFTFDKGPKDIRDRKVWDLAKDSVVEVDLRDAKASLVFTKTTPAGGDAGATKGDAGTTPSWTATKGGKPLVGLEGNKVDDLVNAFALGGVLNADDFGDGKSDEETGLASPDATTLSFRAKDGATKRIVLGKSDGSRRYARGEGDTTVFLLSESPSGWAEADEAKFVTPKGGDAGVDGGRRGDAGK